MNVAVKKMKNTFVGEEADEQKYIFDYYLKMSLSTIDGDFLYEKPLWEDQFQITSDNVKIKKIISMKEPVKIQPKA